MGLLTSILASPAKGLIFTFEQIQREADRELYDEDTWQQKLQDLQLRYDLGEVDDETFEVQENSIIAQLELIREMREEQEEEV